MRGFNVLNQKLGQLGNNFLQSQNQLQNFNFKSFIKSPQFCVYQFYLNNQSMIDQKRWGGSESFNQLLHLQQQLKLRQELNELEAGEKTVRQKRRSITAEFLSKDKDKQEKKERIQDPMKRITLDIIESESMEELVMVLSSRRDQLDYIHLSAAFGRLVLLEQDKKGGAVNAQEIFNLLINKTMDKLMNFEARQISQVIRSVGKFKGYKDPKYIESLCNAVLGLIGDLDSSHYANILQGLSQMRYYKDKQFIRVIIDSMIPKLQNFSVLDLTVILNALAKIDPEESIPFFEKSAYKIQLHMRHLTVQGLTMLAMAYARTGVFNGTLFDGITQNTISKIRRFQPFNMTNLCCSYATLNRADKVLFDEIAKRALQKVQEFQLSDIGKLIDAYSAVGMQNMNLCNVFAQRLIKQIGDCRTQEVSGLLSAFATARYYNQDLLEASDYFIRGSREDFKGDEIVKACHMFSLFEHVDSEIIQILSQLSIPFIENLDSQQITSFVKSLGIVGILEKEENAEILSSILFNINKKFTENDDAFDDEQLGWIYFVMKISGQKTEEKFREQLPQDMLLFGEKVWKENQRRNRKVTNFYAEVLSQLQNLLPEQDIILDNSIDEDFLIPDFQVKYRNNDILVILNDSSLFSINEPYQPLRLIGIKQRFFEKQGFVVINITEHVWFKIVTPIEKQVYLEETMRGLKRGQSTENREEQQQQQQQQQQ